MHKALARLGLSAGAYPHILEVAHATLDLTGNEKIQTAHLVKTMQYRKLERGTE